jgi:hypothetical protein
MADLITQHMYGNPENSMFTSASAPAGGSGGSLTSGDIAIIGSGITSTASTLFGTLAQKQQNQMDAKVAAANAKITLENIKTNNHEYAINTFLTRHSARNAIDSARASMAASGNIGSSAEAAVVQGYKNLDVSLSNMKFNYDTREVALKNQYNVQKYQEKMAKKNAKKSGLSGILGTSLAIVGGAIGAVAGGPVGAAVGASVGSSLGAGMGQVMG